MIKKLKITSIILFLFAISIFCNGYLFLTWDTYSGFIGILAKIFQYFGFLLLPCLLVLRKKGRLVINKKLVLLYVYAIILQIHICLLGSTYKSGLTITIFTLFIDLLCFFFLEKEDRVKIHKYAIYIFAIACLPSLLYFILNLAGIHFPNEILESNQIAKIRNGVYYLHFPLGLLIHQPGALMYRMAGVFDEAGFVGTLAAFFIASGYKRIDNKWIILLLVEGVFSFSMAFYLLLIIFAIFYSIRQGAIKFGVALIILVIAFTIFVNVDFHNSYIEALQNRIDFTSSFLIKDNRTSKGFDTVFENFLNNKNYEYYMGCGKNAVASNNSLNASYSYKCLIYDYGIIGFSLYVLFFVFAAVIWGINRDMIPFLVVFFASIYQRPYVFTTMYIVIYLSALTFMNVEDERKEDRLFLKKGIEQERRNVNTQKNQ